MWVSKIELNNFRSFASASTELSKGINLVIGPNNSGKSTLLKSVAWIQQGSSISLNDLRISQKNGFVKIELLNDTKQYFNHNSDLDRLLKANLFSDHLNLEIAYSHHQGSGGVSSTSIGTSGNYNYSYSIPNREPDNFIYPYLSKRKVISYQETINLNSASSVTGNFSNLYAKIDRLSNPQMPANEQYVQACRDILGFQITAIPSDKS